MELYRLEQVSGTGKERGVTSSTDARKERPLPSCEKWKSHRRLSLFSCYQSLTSPLNDYEHCLARHVESEIHSPISTRSHGGNSSLLVFHRKSLIHLMSTNPYKAIKLCLAPAAFSPSFRRLIYLSNKALHVVQASGFLLFSAYNSSSNCS